MEVSIETLRKTIGAISDEELLRRWGAQLFTEDALPVAEAELVKRGLDFSPANIERVASERAGELRESRSIRYIKLLTSVIVAAGCAGFAAGFGAIGLAIGGAIALPIGTWIARKIDQRVDAAWARFTLGIASFLVMLIISLIASRLVGVLLTGQA